MTPGRLVSDEVREDPVLAALNDLRPWDVDRRRAHRLQLRCRTVLATQHHAATAAADADSARWTHIAGPILLAVWCATYVIEIVRLAAAVYGM